MSIKMCCCLCVTPCSEYKQLENEMGESNEIYEITVKYFDPMLLTEGDHTKFYNKIKLLCQECWCQINNFHDFQQTIIRTRTKLEEINFKQLPSLEVKQEAELSIIDEDCNMIEDGDKEMPLDIFIKEDVVEDNDDNLEENSLVNNEDDEDDDDKPLMLLKKAKSNNKEKKIVKKKLKQTKKIKEKTKLQRGRQAKKIQNTEIIDENGLKLETDKNKKKLSTPKDPQKVARITYCKEKSKESDAAIAKWKTSLECDLCQETYRNFEILRKHFREKHKTKCYLKCCERKFYHRYVLVEHLEIHLNPDLYKCVVCEKSFSSNYNLKFHIKVVHEPFERFECKICHKLFKQKSTLEHHLLTHSTTNKDFICPDCNKGFITEAQLKLHLRQVHNVDRVCDQCGKTLHGRQTYERHLMEHAGIDRNIFPCNICGVKLKTNENLKRHKEAYHNDGSTVYICSICGKIAASEKSLKAHKKLVHEGERKHKCTYCDKAFKKSQNLREHIATHTGEDLYQCPHCPQTFKVSANMHHHRKKVHPVEWLKARKGRLQLPKVDINQVTTKVFI